jgi:general L-amino acid transport system permease protein
MADIADRNDKPASGSLLQNPTVRGAFYQALLILVIAFAAYEAAGNVATNLAKAHVPLNFDFWNAVSGFDINQRLISYSSLSTYGQAFWVGLLNTLLVGAIGIVLATFIGFAVGTARLSKNWIVAKIALVYVETLRNIPLLLQLLFWYNAVLKPLPGPKQSIAIPGGIYLNNRGLILPDPQFGDLAWATGVALLIGIGAAFGYAAWARNRQKRTGEQAPVALVSAGLIVALPLVVYLLTGEPITFVYPVLKGFNFVGGKTVFPEFVALLLGLSVYTASFIAEIVRAGIQSVSRGQTEAGEALGISAGRIRSLVVVPQALRVIIPPLTNQYLNLIKNSSLAVFIGYPDLVQVFAGTVLNQTGAAVQVMGVTMAVYLVISLITSAAMNYYNKRKALVER